ncbi:hypothetical protein GFS60_06562 (plasmid) [Rhodococcus sp. WAY2]|nr:hypothetical protein GFS60_06562 [Rhodococcus sp. WAY2]
MYCVDAGCPSVVLRQFREAAPSAIVADYGEVAATKEGVHRWAPVPRSAVPRDDERVALPTPENFTVERGAPVRTGI